MMLMKRTNTRKDWWPVNPMKTVSQVRITSPLFSGLVYSLCMMTIGTIVNIIISAFNQHTRKFSAYVNYDYSCSFSFIGGWVSGKRAGNRGWYHGGIVA